MSAFFRRSKRLVTIFLMVGSFFAGMIAETTLAPQIERLVSHARHDIWDRFVNPIGYSLFIEAESLRLEIRDNQSETNRKLLQEKHKNLLVDAYDNGSARAAYFIGTMFKSNLPYVDINKRDLIVIRCQQWLDRARAMLYLVADRNIC